MLFLVKSQKRQMCGGTLLEHSVTESTESKERYFSASARLGSEFEFGVQDLLGSKVFGFRERCFGFRVKV